MSQDTNISKRATRARSEKRGSAPIRRGSPTVHYGVDRPFRGAGWSGPPIWARHPEPTTPRSRRPLWHILGMAARIIVTPELIDIDHPLIARALLPIH